VAHPVSPAARAESRLTVVELGAGKAIPTVRIRAERTTASAAVSGRCSGGSLIRINPDPAAAAVPPAPASRSGPARWRLSPRSTRGYIIRNHRPRGGIDHPTYEHLSDSGAKSRPDAVPRRR
jgi:hypothetical protein